MTEKRGFYQHFLEKGLLFGFSLFIFLILIFTVVYLNVLNQPHWISKIILVILLSFFSILSGVLFTRFFIRHFAKKQNWDHLNHFQALSELGVYRVAQSRFYTGSKTFDHMVLLLHGFTTSPNEMRRLLEHFEEKNIPFLAPMLTGFGLTDFHLLERAQHKDWFRSALFYYDFLSAMSNKVTVIGHSMGSVIATYVAEHRSVHRLILCAPALYLFPSDKFLIKMLTAPILSKVVETLIPYLPKTIRKMPASHSSLELDYARFQYLSVPTHSVKEMLHAREKVDIHKIHHTELYMLYGTNDHVVNNQRVLEELQKSGMSYSVVCVEGASHNLFEDHTKEQSCETIVGWLSSDFKENA